MGVVTIILAQWLGTSLWFSPSGAADGLMSWLALDAVGFGWLIAATQLGFIVGTLSFAVTGWADRFVPERIFATCSVAGALLNAIWVWMPPDYGLIWAFRFGVGLTLAGIYPIGMKMIVQRVGGKSGWALGWLVAMLTLGTAMPHILRALGAAWPWQAVMWGSSVLALTGAVLVLSLKAAHSGLAKPGSAATAGVKLSIRGIFSRPLFRACALGYFGHMWELYAFWSVVPLLCAAVMVQTAGAEVTADGVAIMSAVVIGMGSLGCVLGGMLSHRLGNARVAAIALALSGLICLAYPFIPNEFALLKIAALVVWGLSVVADSPQFSAMSAKYAEPHQIGGALAAQNGIGFLITVVSIVVLQYAMSQWGERALWLLAAGPVFGLWAMVPLLKLRYD